MLSKDNKKYGETVYPIKKNRLKCCFLNVLILINLPLQGQIN